MLANSVKTKCPLPSGHQTSFGLPMDVYMKSELHVDVVHWTSKGHLMLTTSELIALPFCKIIIDALGQGAHCFVSFFIINTEQIIV